MGGKILYLNELHCCFENLLCNCLGVRKSYYFFLISRKRNITGGNLYFINYIVPFFIYYIQC